MTSLDEAVADSDGQTDPLVSVIIPVYNHSRYVEYCLNSVRDQGYRNIEILVMDDGSTDDSFEVVCNWCKLNKNSSLVIAAYQQENSGVTKSLNTLLQKATGKYILPIASDDAVLPGGVASRVDELEAAPELDAVIGDCEVIDASNNIVSGSGLFNYKSYSRFCFSQRNLMAREMAIRWQLPGPVLFARKSAYFGGSLGQYHEELVLEDRDLYLKLLATEKLGFVDRVVAQYRVHGENASLTASEHKETRLTHLRNTVMVEEIHQKKFHGLARLGVMLRKKIAQQRIASLQRPGIMSRLWLNLMIAAIAVVYALHRIHGRVSIFFRT